MELPQQIIKEIGILVDKPIGPKVTKQIHQLLLNNNLPADRSVHLLLNKYRSDLLIFMLQNNLYFQKQGTNESHTQYHKFCDHILRNIIEYRLKIQQIIQIYLIILTRLHTFTGSCTDNEELIATKRLLLEIGYSSIVKLAIKKPNLETKQLYLKIMCANAQYLYSTKHKKIIQNISENYLELFFKYFIYVPSYVRMVQIIVNIDYNSKKIMNQVHPQRSENVQEIYIDLSSKQLFNITTQALKTLQNTSQKLNNYELHKCCLKVLGKVGSSLNSFRIKESDLYFKEIDLLSILRQSQKYIGVKGTIDDARLCKREWEAVKKQLNSLKSEKAIKISSDRALIQNNSNPILIENVIGLTNNYRLKYQVQNPLSNSQLKYDVNVSNNFLKKGMGIGGGRTFVNSVRDSSKKQGSKNVALYDKIVDNCFTNMDKQLEYKSYVEPYIQALSQYTPKQQTKTKYSKPLNLQLESKPYINNSQILPNNSTMTYNQEEEDYQIEEINNLIDLAYSYKFS